MIEMRGTARPGLRTGRDMTVLRRNGRSHVVRMPVGSLEVGMPRWGALIAWRRPVPMELEIVHSQIRRSTPFGSISCNIESRDIAELRTVIREVDGLGGLGHVESQRADLLAAGMKA